MYAKAQIECEEMTLIGKKHYESLKLKPKCLICGGDNVNANNWDKDKFNVLIHLFPPVADARLQDLKLPPRTVVYSLLHMCSKAENTDDRIPKAVNKRCSYYCKMSINMRH